MHVISQKSLRTFWEVHPTAEGPLRAWYRLIKRSRLESPEALKGLFGAKVDQYRQFTIFDVGGNKFRLIAVVNYDNQKVFVRHVLSHHDYNSGAWKTDTFRVKRPWRRR